MGKRKYYKKDFKDKGKFNNNKRDITSQVKSNVGSNEQQTKSTDIFDGISKVAMKDLYKSSYAIKVDPYTEANQAQQPYDLLHKFNDKFQPSYKGRENLDGGYVSQYLTANDTRLLNVFDAAKLEVSINYRYLPLSRHLKFTGDPTDAGDVVDPDNYTVISNEQNSINAPSGTNLHEFYRGAQLIRKMYDAVNEAVSQLDATTFTYLTMNTNYSCLSSICIPGANYKIIYEGSAGDYNVYYAYTDVSAVILLMSIEYQCGLQSALTALKLINKTKNAEGLLIKMNYNRETGPLNQFFGQFNKSSFAQLLTSIKLGIMGEYVDSDWGRNTNIMTQLLSRKADDMIDPILEIQPNYNFIFENKFFSKSNGKFMADWEDYDVKSYDDYKAYLVWNGGSVENTVNNSRCAYTRTGVATHEYQTINKLLMRLGRLISPTELLKWSRNTLTESAVERYNKVTWIIEAIDKEVTLMKTMFGDLRTVFDKLTSIGIVNYKKGITVELTDDYNVKPIDYMLIDDIFKMTLSGNALVTFSDRTGRWTAWTLWNRYTGIPKFDAMSGGAFISFCTKSFDLASSLRTDLEYLPVAFTCLNSNDNYSSATVLMVNRAGFSMDVSTYTATSLGSANDICRLSILPNFDTYDFKAPTTSTVLTTMQAAYAKFVLLQICDACYINGAFEINSDIIAVYNYEIDPIEKPMITYAKAFGPFKGVTDSEADMGFAGLSTLNTDR